MSKSKKWICAKKLKDFQAKNLSSQSGLFFITNTKKSFTKLRQAFIKVPILNHFDLERHIQIETDTSGYIIGKILSQLTLNDLRQ